MVWRLLVGFRFSGSVPEATIEEQGSALRSVAWFLILVSCKRSTKGAGVGTHIQGDLDLQGGLYHRWRIVPHVVLDRNWCIQTGCRPKV